jgi:hypothetical protein
MALEKENTNTVNSQPCREKTDGINTPTLLSSTSQYFTLPSVRKSQMDARGRESPGEIMAQKKVDNGK